MTSLVKGRSSARRLARSLAVKALVRELSIGVLAAPAAVLAASQRASHVLGTLDAELADAEARRGRLQLE